MQGCCCGMVGTVPARRQAEAVAVPSRLARGSAASTQNSEEFSIHHPFSQMRALAGLRQCRYDWTHFCRLAFCCSQLHQAMQCHGYLLGAGLAGASRCWRDRPQPRLHYIASVEAGCLDREPWGRNLQQDAVCSLSPCVRAADVA